MKKLFRVSIEVSEHVYVMAKNSSEAEYVASMEADDLDYDYYATEVTVCTDGCWVNAQPYGSDDDRTIAQILQKEEKDKKEREYLEKYCPELPFGDFK